MAELPPVKLPQLPEYVLRQAKRDSQAALSLTEPETPKEEAKRLREDSDGTMNFDTPDSVNGVIGRVGELRATLGTDRSDDVPILRLITPHGGKDAPSIKGYLEKVGIPTEITEKLVRQQQQIDDTNATAERLRKGAPLTAADNTRLQPLLGRELAGMRSAIEDLSKRYEAAAAEKNSVEKQLTAALKTASSPEQDEVIRYYRQQYEEQEALRQGALTEVTSLGKQHSAMTELSIKLNKGQPPTADEAKQLATLADREASRLRNDSVRLKEIGAKPGILNRLAMDFELSRQKDATTTQYASETALGNASSLVTVRSFTGSKSYNIDIQSKDSRNPIKVETGPGGLAMTVPGNKRFTSELDVAAVIEQLETNRNSADDHAKWKPSSQSDGKKPITLPLAGGQRADFTITAAENQSVQIANGGPAGAIGQMQLFGPASFSFSAAPDFPVRLDERGGQLIAIPADMLDPERIRTGGKVLNGAVTSAYVRNPDQTYDFNATKAWEFKIPTNQADGALQFTQRQTVITQQDAPLDRGQPFVNADGAIEQPYNFSRIANEQAEKALLARYAKKIEEAKLNPTNPNAQSGNITLELTSADKSRSEFIPLIKDNVLLVKDAAELAQKVKDAQATLKAKAKGPEKPPAAPPSMPVSTDPAMRSM